MIEAILIVLALPYLASAVHVLRRLVWHFCRNKDKYDRDGAVCGAAALALALPVGLLLMWHLDRTLEREGGAAFMLPPRSIRKGMRVKQLEQQNREYERRLELQ